MKTYNVVFHRHYYVTSEQVEGWDKHFDTVEEAVEAKAMKFLHNDLKELSWDTLTFVPATVEEI